MSVLFVVTAIVRSAATVNALSAVRGMRVHSVARGVARSAVTVIVRSAVTATPAVSAATVVRRATAVPARERRDASTAMTPVRRARRRTVANAVRSSPRMSPPSICPVPRATS